MIDYTTTALLASIKRRGVIPDSQILYSDDDIIKIATEEFHSIIVPLILAVREEYMVTDYDQTIVAGTKAYPIHPRAFGQKLADAVLVNAEGDEIGMGRTDPGQIKNRWAYGNIPDFPNKTLFYFKDDRVVLFPDESGVAGTYLLREKIYRRPNNLVATSAAGQITLINTTTKTVTVSNFPATFIASEIYDLIKGEPSFRSWGDDLAVSAVDSVAKTITFSAALPTGLAVHDWVCLSGFSPIPQVPYEVHHLLAQRTTIKVLEGLGDADGLRSAADVYKDMVEKFTTMVTPRADKSPKKVVRRNILFGGGSSQDRRW